MTSAATPSPESHQGNGSLKLKIKFSTSKGFVSDFVNESVPDSLLTAKESLPSRFPNNITPIKQQSHRLLCPSSTANINNSNDKSVNILSTTDSNCQELNQKIDDEIDETLPNCELKESQSLSSACLNSNNVTHKLNDQAQETHEETTEKQFCCDFGSKPAGHNYDHDSNGDMFQDLQFSHQHAGTDRRYPDPTDHKRGQHLSTAPKQLGILAIAEPSSITEEEFDRGDSFHRDRSSEDECMSPFNFNCSSGLAEENATFSTSNQYAVDTQNRLKKENMENPLFSWSVESSCTSQSDYSSDSHKLDSQMYLQSDANLAPSEKVGQCPPQSLTVKGRAAQETDSENPVNRVILLDFRSGSRNSEINNNSQLAQIAAGISSSSVSGDRLNNPHEEIPTPKNVILATPSVSSSFAVLPPSADHPSLSHNLEPVDLSTHTTAGDLQSLNLSSQKSDRSDHKQDSVEDKGDSQYYAAGSYNLPSFVDNILCADAILKHQSTGTLASHTLSQTRDAFVKRPNLSSHPLSGSALDLRTISHSHDFPKPQDQTNKKYTNDQIGNKLLWKILTRRGTVPNILCTGGVSSEHVSPPHGAEESLPQVTENPQLVENVSVPPPQTVSDSHSSSDCLTSTPLTHLCHTIGELRKRLKETSVSTVNTEDDSSPTNRTHSSEICTSSASSTKTNSSEICTSSASSTKTDSSEICTSSASSTKTKSKLVSLLWCRCEEPESLNILEQDVCNKCQKKLSKRWKKLSRRDIKGKRDGSVVWCHCQSPDPFIPDGTVNELCRKCNRRVSKVWKKTVAAKWCKCYTPILHRYKLPGNEDQNTNTFYTCKRCQKWVSKEKESVSMIADLTSFPEVAEGQKTLPPIGPRPVMTDHNYSQSPFCPESVPKPSTELHVSNSSQPKQLCPKPSSSYSLLSQSNVPMQSAVGSSNIVYVYPPSVQSHSGQTNLRMQTTLNEHTFDSASLSSAVRIGGIGTITATSFGPPELHPANSSEIPSRNLQAQCALSGSHLILPQNQLRKDAESLHHSTGVDNSPVETSTPVSVNTSPKVHNQSSFPIWLQGVSQELLQPCYVVLTRLDNMPMHKCAAYSDPCPASCRQHSLDVMCQRGKLQQCGHSLEHCQPFDQNDQQHLSVCKMKKDYFRRFKTLVGYEEYRQKEIDKRRCRRQRQRAAILKAKSNNTHSTSSGFLSLSSANTPGHTNFRISSVNGVRIQQLSDCSTVSSHTVPETHTGPVSSARMLVSQSNSFVTPTQTTHQNVNRRTQIQTADPNSSPVGPEKEKHLLSDQHHRKGWSKFSQFNVKYYAFNSKDRAFIVPLIKNKQNKRKVQHLDEEDMAYVKAAIRHLLVETNSCARHLGYPDSLQHKGSKTAVTQSAQVEQSSSKKTFVAPTLGAEDLDIEALKTLISDRDFSRLVPPKKTRVSKSKYLQEIGEKVHMYLTGGSEETPEWIKDVAKSIVFKHRSRGKTKKRQRLKPSKDVTIEIDYAAESEAVDIGEEDVLSAHCDDNNQDSSATLNQISSMSQSVTENHCNIHPHSNHPTEQTGSFVVAEAFSQEEKKPLLQNIGVPFQQSNISEVHGNMPEMGQHIFVPLPNNCCNVQDTTEDHVGLPSVDGVQNLPLCETIVGVNENQIERKPLLGELLAAAVLPAPRTDDGQTLVSYNTMGEQVLEQQIRPIIQQAEQPTTPIALAHVKTEPLEDDFSHAWSNGQSKLDTFGNVPASSNPIPFISNSTFGPGAVSIEDEEGSALPFINQVSDGGPSIETPPFVKTEPYDSEYDNAMATTPVVTCIAPGEVAALLAKSESNKRSNTEEIGAFSGHTYHGQPVEQTQVFSITCRNTPTQGADMYPHGVISTETVEVDLSSVQSGAPIISPIPIEMEKYASSECHEDKMTFGEIVNKSIQRSFEGQPDTRESIPQISAIAFGEAAMFWERSDNEHSPKSLEVSQTSSSSQHESPVVHSVVIGADGTHSFIGQMEGTDGQQIVSHDDHNEEEYLEDFGEDDDYYEDGDGGVSEQEPSVAVENQVFSVPLILPEDNSKSEQNPLACMENQVLSVPLILPEDKCMPEQKPVVNVANQVFSVPLILPNDSNVPEKKPIVNVTNQALSVPLILTNDSSVPEPKPLVDVENQVLSVPLIHPKDNYMPEQKPLVNVENQVLSIPLILPGAVASQAGDEQERHVPEVQIGIDLSIVKQELAEEPEEANPPNLAISVQQVADCNNVPSGHQTEAESAPFPSILNVRSLASLGAKQNVELPSVDLSSKRSQLQSSVKQTSTDAVLSPTKLCDSHAVFTSSETISVVLNKETLNQPKVNDGYSQAAVPELNGAQNQDCSNTRKNPMPTELNVDVNSGTLQIPTLSNCGDNEQFVMDTPEKLQDMDNTLVVVSSVSKSKKRNKKSSGKRKCNEKQRLKTSLRDAKKVVAIDNDFSHNTVAFEELGNKPSTASIIPTSNDCLVEGSEVAADEKSNSGTENGDSLLTIPQKHAVEEKNETLFDRKETTLFVDIGQPADFLSSQSPTSDTESVKECPTTKCDHGTSEQTREDTLQSNSRTKATNFMCSHPANQVDGNHLGVQENIVPSIKDTPCCTKNTMPFETDKLQQEEAFKPLNRPGSPGELLSSAKCIPEVKDTQTCLHISQPDLSAADVELDVNDFKDASPTSSGKGNQSDSISCGTIPIEDSSTTSLQRRHTCASSTSSLVNTTDLQSKKEYQVTGQTTSTKNRVETGIVDCPQTVVSKQRKGKKRAHSKSRKLANTSLNKTNICDVLVKPPNSSGQPDLQSVCDEKDTSVIRQGITQSLNSFPKPVSDTQEIGFSEIPVDSSKLAETCGEKAGRKSPEHAAKEKLLHSAVKLKELSVVLRDCEKYDQCSGHNTSLKSYSPTQQCSTLENPPPISVTSPISSHTTKANIGKSPVSTHTPKADLVEEKAHYVSRFATGWGKDGRTCLVLKKTRPFQFSGPQKSSDIVPHKENETDYPGKADITDDVTVNNSVEKYDSVPSKRSKCDIKSDIQIHKVEENTSDRFLIAPTLKRRSDQENLEENTANCKMSKAERSIFSDMTAVLSSFATSSSKSVSSEISKPSASKDAPKTTKSAESKGDATVSVVKKRFNDNLFSRLQASLSSMKGGIETTKSEKPCSILPNVESSVSSQTAHERSFFDCLPQGFVDAWKKQ